MRLFAGIYDSQWGHTWLARASEDSFYVVRSLAEGASVCLMKTCGKAGDVVTQKDMVLRGELSLPGSHPCHITVLESQLAVSDYSSGTLTLVATAPDGTPQKVESVVKFEGSGPVLQRQSSPHIHSSWKSPDSSELVVADLGCDRLYGFSLRGGKMDVASRKDFVLPAGCGPRHCAFHPGGRRLYVSTELSDELLVYDYPSMTLLQRLTVNDSLPGGGAHLLLNPAATALYVSSRGGNDGIGIFRLDGNGMPEKIGYCPCGSHPRHFCINADGSRLAVACRDGNKIEIYNMNPSTAMLSAVTEISVQKPVFVDFTD